MSRKNFLSTDFFVTATEADAKQAVTLLPQHITYLTLLKDNPLLHSLRFLYEDKERQSKYYIDVSMLPLNDLYVRLSVHVSHTNGRGIHTDAELGPVLQRFEKAVHAAVNKDFSSLATAQKTKPARRRPSFFSTVFLSLIFSKYHY